MISMDLLHGISPGSTEELNVIIEIPKGCRVKYELDKETGLMKVDRINYAAMAHPAAYGFVPQSHCEDGDPLDVFVLVSEPLVPGCLIVARPIGLLNMIDDGERDSKIIAVAIKDPRFASVKDLKDIEPHTPKEIKHFLEHYKDLQGKKVVVENWEDVAAARKEIERSLKLYQQKFGKGKKR
jgi:inorganic pyrophosphatase